MAFNQSKPNLPHMVSSLVGISGGSLQEIGKAKSMLEAYVNGTRKTRPPKKILDLLEKHKIITKKSGSGRMPKNHHQKEVQNFTLKAVKNLLKEAKSIV